jgi:flagellar biosynthesis component FlhA
MAGIFAEGFLSKSAKHGDIIAVAAVVIILSMMVMPLPAFLLDTFLALNISMALLVLLVTMNVQKPLEFSAFPSLLLLDFAPTPARLLLGQQPRIEIGIHAHLLTRHGV